MTLILFAVAWLLGVLLADLLHLPLAPLLALAAVSVVGAALTGREHRLRMAALLCCCAALGGARLAAAAIPTTPSSVWLLNGQPALTLVGVVSEDPRRTEVGQRVVLAAERVEADGVSRAVEGLVLVDLPPYPERSYGDRLELAGVLKTPREAERPGQFDYQAYLARKGIFSLMQPQASRLSGTGHGSAVLARLLVLRDSARRVLLRELPEPQSSLAIGILLGLQSSIPDEVYDRFSATGTSHILIISGWNITIIAGALYAVAGRLRLSADAAFWAILATIWLYTLFVGATPTVIRAALMGSVVVLGKRLERRSHPWVTLFAACWAMTVWNPQTLWDMGFQLSALATASLFAFGKPTEALLLKTPLRHGWLGWAREALTATLAAQILALPLILFHFGNLSIIAPLANVALLPMVPYAMLFGALALLGGMLWLPLGQWLATIAYLFLGWLTEGVRLFAELPYAAVQIPSFPLWMLLAYYAIVMGGWLRSQAHQAPDDELALSEAPRAM